MGAGEFCHRGAVAAETERFDEEFMTGVVPAHFANAGAGVFRLRAESLEGPAFESECHIAFGGEHAPGGGFTDASALPRTAAHTHSRCSTATSMSVNFHPVDGRSGSPLSHAKRHASPRRPEKEMSSYAGAT